MGVLDKDYNYLARYIAQGTLVRKVEKVVFEVFTVVSGINIVFLFVTPCSLTEAQSFGGNCAT
jgi:hypothetical protein